MHASGTQLIAGAFPAVLAGFFILSISDVGRTAWVVQGGSVAVMLVLAAALAAAPRTPSRRSLAWMAASAMLLCALPLSSSGDGPRRWLHLGPTSIYIAPVVIPALLALAACARRWGRVWERASLAGLCMLAAVLAIQPDLSQVLALTAGAAPIIARSSGRTAGRLLVSLPLAAAGWLAAVQVDPLSPVAYVEDVILLAWGHSTLAGIGVSAAACAVVATTAVCLARIDVSLVAVAAYYGVLFLCSLAGLTPAPLIGYGPGPVLGFGLLAGTAAGLARERPGLEGAACLDSRPRAGHDVRTLRSP